MAPYVEWKRLPCLSILYYRSNEILTRYSPHAFYNENHDNKHLDHSHKTHCRHLDLMLFQIFGLIIFQIFGHSFFSSIVHLWSNYQRWETQVLVNVYDKYSANLKRERKWQTHNYSRPNLPENDYRTTDSAIFSTWILILSVSCSSQFFLILSISILVPTLKTQSIETGTENNLAPNSVFVNVRYLFSVGMLLL